MTLFNWLKNYFRDWVEGWDDFWFRPSDPLMLGFLRLLAGAVIFYNHLAWSAELKTFFGSNSLLPISYRGDLLDGPSYLWSHFDWLPSDQWLWPVHVLGLAVMAMFCLGFLTRITGILTALLVISYGNRVTGAQFGLDQINAFLAMYLALGPSGTCFSVDRWLAKGQGSDARFTSATVSIRLIQVHMCIVYFFAGIGKLQGDTWWYGTAIWGAVANYEYQTIDLTWLASRLAIVNFLTYATLFWEVSYPFLIWPRLTRPVWIAAAVAVHLGIGLGMGMLTFGLIMIIGNLAFIDSKSLNCWMSIPKNRAGGQKIQSEAK